MQLELKLCVYHPLILSHVCKHASNVSSPAARAMQYHNRLFDTDPQAAKSAPGLSANAFMAVVTAALSGLAGHVGVGRHQVELLRYDQHTCAAVVQVHRRSLVLVHSALVLFGNYGGRPCRFEIAELSDNMTISSDAVSEKVSSTSTDSPCGRTINH